MKDYFNEIKVEKPEFQMLPAGEHTLRVVRGESLTSFQQFNGNDKDELPAWANPTMQFAVTVVAAEEGKSGGMTHRLNGQGWLKYDDLNDKQVKSGKYEDINGYACYKDDDGDIVREEDPEKTKACMNIINQFASSVGIKPGTKFASGVNNAIENQSKFRGTVSVSQYEGKDQYRLTRFRSIAAVEVEQFED